MINKILLYIKHDKRKSVLNGARHKDTITIRKREGAFWTIIIITNPPPLFVLLTHCLCIVEPSISLQT